MLYEVMKEATGLAVGETYSPEDLAKKGDVNNMVRKGIVRPVGFITAGVPMSDSEASKAILELQEKLEKTEDERDHEREEVKQLKRKISALEAGHRAGSKQLEEANQDREKLREECEKLRGELARLRKSATAA